MHRSPAVDEQWQKLFRFLGDSRVDLSRAIVLIAQLVLLEREDWLMNSEAKTFLIASDYLGSCTFEASQMPVVNSCIALLKNRAKDFKI